MLQENLEKSITKMVNITKPNGVSFIELDLKPVSDDKHCMSIDYVVPDDSLFLKMMSSPKFAGDLRQNWNQSIIKSIKNYFNVNVIINSSGLKSESWYKQNNIK